MKQTFLKMNCFKIFVKFARSANSRNYYFFIHAQYPSVENFNIKSAIYFQKRNEKF